MINTFFIVMDLIDFYGAEISKEETNFMFFNHPSSSPLDLLYQSNLFYQNLYHGNILS